eukprot:316591-Pleurochrysis_carterae.AAC.2
MSSQLDFIRCALRLCFTSTLVEESQHWAPHRAQSVPAALVPAQMPVLDGIQTTRAIREYEREQRVPRQDRLRIIGFSANGDDDFCREQASDVGFDAMLCKPLKMTLLKACLAGIDGRDAAHAAEAR